MFSLNKKIPQEQAFQSLQQITLLQIILAVAVAAVIQTSLNQEFYYLQFTTIILGLTVLALCKYSVGLGSFLTVLIALNFLSFDNFLLVAGLAAFIYVLYKFICLKSVDLSLLILANLMHLGDALTTYQGLNQGLEESNILLIPILETYGYYTIFPIKALVIPLTIYPYLKFTDSKRNIYLKTVFAIGLYLTFNNLMHILYI